MNRAPHSNSGHSNSGHSNSGHNDSGGRPPSNAVSSVGRSSEGTLTLDAMTIEIQDLLAGRALGDLTPDDAPAALDAARLYDVEADWIESAAGVAYLAMAQGALAKPGQARSQNHTATHAPEAVPDEVIARLHRLADAFLAASTRTTAGPVLSIARTAPVGVESSPRIAPGNTRTPRGLWLALAASVALAAMGWLLAGRQLSRMPASPLVPFQVREQVSARADAVTIPWSEWSDADVHAEVAGVTGEVVWSDQAQSGVMRLVGLPHIQGSVYQLWIIDGERGMSQRVSGAIFSAGDKETWVTIEPQLGISRAAAFAITIEQPGGTWVSDMTRRVVIAARPA